MTLCFSFALSCNVFDGILYISQILRLVLGLGRIRKKWEELYLEGRVLEDLSENTSLLRLGYRGVGDTIKRRDFVVVRASGDVTTTVKRKTKEVVSKTYVVFSQSVTHSAAPPTKHFIRGDAQILGWLIKEIGFSSCLVTRIVLVDYQGKIPGNEVSLLAQKMASLAVVNLKSEVENIRERTIQIMLHSQSIYLPCVCKLHYSHVGITKAEWENSDRGATFFSPHLCSLFLLTPLFPPAKPDNVQNDNDFIAAKENEQITIIAKREDSKWWVAYHNGKRGLVHLDYLDPSILSLIHKKFIHTSEHPSVLMVRMSLALSSLPLLPLIDLPY